MTLDRPEGFAPGEISDTINREVVDQHTEEAAFLWALRERAVGEPHYALTAIVGLDDRVEAHLDGLRVARDVGWELCKAKMANDGPGEVFALAALAFGAGDLQRMRYALDAGSASPALLPGLVSALGWLDYGSIAEWMRRLLEARLSAHRRVGIAAYAVHRQDPGPALFSALHDPDPGLRARALRATGEIKRHDLYESVRVHLEDEEEPC